MSRRNFLSLAAVAIALLIIVVGVPLPSGSRYWEQIENSAHVVFFTFISILLTGNLRTSARLSRQSDWIIASVAFIACLVLGVGTEFCQQYVPGRDPDILDALRDGAGAICGISAWRFVRVTRAGVKSIWPPRIALAVVSLAALSVGLGPLVGWQMAFLQRNLQFPIICDFQSQFDSYFYVVQSGDLSVVAGTPEQQWTTGSGNQVAELDFAVGEYPGVTFDEIKKDWSGYDSLQFEVNSGLVDTISLGVRIDDDLHNYQPDDRYTEEFAISPGHHLVSIPLEKIKHAPKGRLLELKQIARIIIFLDHPGKELRLYLDNLRLR